MERPDQHQYARLRLFLRQTVEAKPPIALAYGIYKRTNEMHASVEAQSPLLLSCVGNINGNRGRRQCGQQIHVVRVRSFVCNDVRLERLNFLKDSVCQLAALVALQGSGPR